MEAQLFEIRTSGCHFVKNHLKSGQKCPDFKWSGFLMVGTKANHLKTAPFEILPSKIPDFRSPLYLENKVIAIRF